MNIQRAEVLAATGVDGRAALLVVTLFIIAAGASIVGIARKGPRR